MTLDKEKLNKQGIISRSLSLYDRHALQEPFRILKDQIVNQINDIYRNKKDLCRRVARPFYIGRADFERRKASDEKVNQEADPWPFEIDETDRPLKPKREWKWPRDAEAIHVFLMLFRDTLMPADPILTAEIREICPKLVLHHYYLYNSRFLRRDMESLLAYAAEDKKFKNKPSKDPEQSADPRHINLQQFFNVHCDLSDKPDLSSKRKMLLQEDGKRIKLPLVGTKKDYRRGQTYLYLTDKLLTNWQTYRKILSTLPPLK